MCCKVMAIDALEKPAGVWCGDCTPGKGCGVYDSRPSACRVFRCAWLADPTMAVEYRPDKTKVVMEFDGKRLVAHCDPDAPTAWRREPVFSGLKALATRHWRTERQVVVALGRRLWLITPSEEIDLGEVDARSPYTVEMRQDGTATVTILAPLRDDQQFNAGRVMPGRPLVTPKAS